MRSVRKTLYGAGAVVAVAALVVAGVNYSSTPKVDGAPLAAEVASVPVSAIPAEQLKAMLLPLSAHPEGSTVTELTLQQAVAGGFNETPPDMVVTPARCADGLSDGVGDPAKTTGWAQFGTTPSGELFVGVAASVNDGVRFDRIRETIAACSAATVKLTSHGLVGTMRFSEFAGPVLFGAQTIGVRSTTTFPGQQVPEGARLIVEALNISTVYVGQGTLLLMVCKPQMADASQMASAMYGLAASG